MTRSTQIVLASVGGGCLLLLCAGAFGALFFGGVVSAIAVPNFVSMQLKAKRAEAPGNVSAIATMEYSYDAAFDAFLPVGSRAEATRYARVQGAEAGEGDWSGPWQTLGWRPEGPTRCGYWVEVREGRFEAHGVCDVDGDGALAEYVLSSEGVGAWEDPDEY